ncbi:MAG: hypothetical protein IJY38_04160 [Clostridia bacterium]|nr:hypothetical protein [Clostridia bacterium]
MVVIADGKPQQLGLLDIIRHYVKYQREIILKRTLFDLNQAEQRCHVLEGMIVAVQNIDEVIAIIKKSESTADAKSKLMARFSLSDVQAQAILDLRLARLTKLEVYKLEQELKELQKKIKRLRAISKSKDLQLEVVKEEITEIKEKYGTPRKSKLVYTQEEADGLLSCPVVKKQGVNCTLVYTADEKFKVLTDKQKDALKANIDGKFKPQIIPVLALDTVTDKQIFVFTNFGNCHRVSVFDLDTKMKLSDKGIALSDLSTGCVVGEKAVAMFAIGEKFPMTNLVFFTKNGMVKKSEWQEYDQRKTCFEAIKLLDGDEVISVEEESQKEEDALMFVTKDGICLRAKSDGIAPKGRVSMGVKGISLKSGDEVIFASQIGEEGQMIIATDEGKFKQVIVSLIKLTGRDNKGALIVDMKDGASVLYAGYAENSCTIAVADKAGSVAELSSDWIPILTQSSKARRVSPFAEDSVKKVLPMICKK